MRLAREFDRQGGFALADFVGPAPGRPPTTRRARSRPPTTEEEGTSIRLMSVHQAKGLEFPIVVLPDLNRKPNQRDSMLGIHPDLGLVVRPSRQGLPRADETPEPDAEESLGWLAFQAIEAEEERKESLRLFYVATTRARDHLILSTGLDVEAETADHAGTNASDSDCPAAVAPRAASTAFQLLLERFDWRSGHCLAELAEDAAKPRVNVVMPTPPEAGPRRPRTPLRQRLEEIEQSIRRTPVGESRGGTRSIAMPRFVELIPETAGNSRSRRLGSLARLLIADHSLFRGEPLDQAAERAGDRQIPCAGSALVREAIAFLDSWPDTPLFQEIRQAARN